MNKSKLIIRDSETGEVLPLSRDERKLLNKRIKDTDNPVRYIVVSELVPRKRYFYYIANDSCYGMEIDQASKFKRYDIADAICKVLNKESNREHHIVVKITTKNDTIKVLKYFRRSIK